MAERRNGKCPKKKQLLLLGKVVRAPEGHPMKVASFIPGTLRPATERYVRRVGRPRIEWIRYAWGQACILGGSEEEVRRLASDVASWSALVNNQ